MKWLKRIVFASLMLISMPMVAQQRKEIKSSDYTNKEVTMADRMREDGHIYVLVAIIVVILSGLLFYTFRTDQKIRKVEKQLEEKE